MKYLTKIIRTLKLKSGLLFFYLVAVDTYCTSKNYPGFAEWFSFKSTGATEKRGRRIPEKTGSLPLIVEKNVADGVNEEDESIEYVVNSLKNNINNFVMHCDDVPCFCIL